MKEFPMALDEAVAWSAWTGRKTEDRVVIEIPREYLGLYLNGVGEIHEAGGSPNSGSGKLHDIVCDVRLDKNGLPHYLVAGGVGWMEGICPSEQVGDRLWVQEVWAPTKYPCHESFAYKVDYGDSKSDYVDEWLPATEMPREISRVIFEIVDIRIQRLQDITEEEAIAEGIFKMCSGYWAGAPHEVKGTPRHMVSAVEGFRDRWDSRPGQEHPWETNPWVWVRSLVRLARMPGLPESLRCPGNFSK